MVATRRMGAVDSVQGDAMLNAAEAILRDEGYPALTSRRVAEHLGLTQRLVYYYFRTMDDLVLETFRRLAIRELQRLRSATSSNQPLHHIWSVCMNTSDARLISEFMALANRIEALRQEVINFIEESRKIQIAALKKVLPKGESTAGALPPEVIAFFGTSLALALTRESALGVRKAHSSVQKVIEQFLCGLEQYQNV